MRLLIWMKAACLAQVLVLAGRLVLAGDVLLSEEPGVLTVSRAPRSCVPAKVKPLYMVNFPEEDCSRPNEVLQGLLQEAIQRYREVTLPVDAQLHSNTQINDVIIVIMFGWDSIVFDSSSFYL
jgi:hypothetical protein